MTQKNDNPMKLDEIKEIYFINSNKNLKASHLQNIGGI